MRRTGESARTRVAVVATVVMTVGLGLAPVRAAASAQIRSEHPLYSFAGPNGAGPLSGVSVGPGGVLYGSTVFGGLYGGGCVFALTPDGSRYTERLLFSFNGTDGAKPAGKVVAGPHGELFGATSLGGTHDAGTVFELVPSKSGYTEMVLYSFTGYSDGQEPIGAPAMDPEGDIFGVTQFGGASGEGVVFEVEPSPGGYTEKVLHSFADDTGQPQAGLTRSNDGTLYGTLYGFSEVNQDGSVFSVRLRRTGPVYADVYNFRGGTDGANPYAALTVDSSGVIYGTTEYGGGVGSAGTVFSLTPSGRGYQESVLHAFTRRSAGVLPEAPLLRTTTGALLGTADIGGQGCSGIGCGTVFELEPAGSSYAFRVVYRFAGPPSDGAEPQWSGVVQETSGDLVGTTRSGGRSHTCSDGGPGGVLGCGTVYRITS